MTWVTELNHQLELMEVETYHASEATALALESAVLRPGCMGRFRIGTRGWSRW